MQDPIDRIEWVEATSLHANDYNPNVVVTPELKLLEFSLLTNGWIQPVLVDPEGNIIDGFHRWCLSRDSEACIERWGGKVPAAVIDCTRAEAMMLTIRINRAKGSHVAVRMSKVVRELIDVHGINPDEIAQGIGATRAEVDLLYQEDVFKVKDIKNAKYSNAWVPVEAEERPAELIAHDAARKAAKKKPVRDRNPSMTKSTGSTRFNSPKYLKAWQAGEGYPKIHNAIAAFFDKYGLGESCVDLCGNTGLLATRIIEAYDTPCIVVEAADDAIAVGREYGVPAKHYQMLIEPATYEDLFAVLDEHNVDTFVARRCISELFTGPDDPDGVVFAKGLIDLGVTKLFLQGRQPTKKATHPIPTIDEEVALFLSHYRVVEKKGQVAYLVPA